MFDKPGKKIKELSVIFFWIGTVISVILAFVFGIEKSYGYYYNEYTTFHAGIFFTLFIGIPFVLYISTLFLVGFGELVESSSKVAKNDGSITSGEELPEL